MSDTRRRTDAVAATLAARVLTDILPAGTRLPSDTALCDEFGVSRTVIREAFRILSGKGLIIAKPRLGTIVAERAHWSLFDTEMLAWLEACGAIADYLDDLTDIRLALEPSLAALAAARADADANKTLQNALRALQEDPSHPHEEAFLVAFYAMSGNLFAQAALPLSVVAIHHRDGTSPLAAYGRLTAAIAQKNGVAARQAALETLIEA